MATVKKNSGAPAAKPAGKAAAPKAPVVTQVTKTAKAIAPKIAPKLAPKITPKAPATPAKPAAATGVATTAMSPAQKAAATKAAAKAKTVSPATAKAATPAKAAPAKAAPKVLPKPAPKKAVAAPVVEEQAPIEISDKVGRKELAELIQAKVRSTGKAVPLDIARIMVVSYEECVAECLAAGAEVALPGFGKFLTKEKPEAIKRNPATGEDITVAAHKQIRFRVGAKLKQSVNGSVDDADEAAE